MSKRELIDTGTDKRYVRRDESGKFKQSVDVGRSCRRTGNRRRNTMPSPARRQGAIARTSSVKIATYNVNGVNGRLEVLLRWLGGGVPRRRLPSELKAPDPKFPRQAHRGCGYGAIWHGQKVGTAWAILARDREPNADAQEACWYPDDTHSPLYEAAIDGIVIGCLICQTGIPIGIEVRIQAAWFHRLTAYAAELLELDVRGSSLATTTSCRRNSMSTNRSVG